LNFPDIFAKTDSGICFYENVESSCSMMVKGRTDRREKANSRFSKFY